MCSVTLVGDESAGKLHSMVERIIEARSSPAEVNSAWMQQFRDAVTPGAAHDEDGEELPLSISTIILHYMSISWKLLFAVVPPPGIFLCKFPSILGCPCVLYIHRVLCPAACITHM